MNAVKTIQNTPVVVRQENISAASLNVISHLGRISLEYTMHLN